MDEEIKTFTQCYLNNNMNCMKKLIFTWASFNHCFRKLYITYMPFLGAVCFLIESGIAFKSQLFVFFKFHDLLLKFVNKVRNKKSENI